MGEAVFIPGSKLRDAVFELLKDGEKSISAIYRDLDSVGLKYHRLVVTGYLKGMEDMGALKSKDIPPSRVYMLPAVRERNIYETVGALAREIHPDDAALVCTLALQRLFRRPIFEDELRSAGLADEAGSMERVTGEERMEVKRALAKRGHNITDNNPAYKAKGDAELEKKACDLLVYAILSRYDAHSLVIETKQLRLGDV